MSIVNNYLGRVVQIRIKGAINKNMSTSIFKSIMDITYLPVKAIVVTINSHGGSLTQAKNVRQILLNLKRLKKVPLYCFAEDQCLSAANIVLTSGDQCYANKMSILGGMGFVWNNFNFSRLAEQYGVTYEKIRVNQCCYNYNFMEPLKEETLQFTKNQLNFLSKDIRQQILKNRKKKIEQQKTKIQQIQQNIFKKPAVVAQTMVKYNLIDGVKNYWELIEQKYKKSRIFVINQQEMFDQIRYAAKGQNLLSMRQKFGQLQ